MSQDARWIRMRELFGQLTELKEQKREAFLQVHCGDDAELRAELLELLAADTQPSSDSPLTRSLGAEIEQITQAQREALIGTQIGPYRLTGVIGHGGAGTVYLGERSDKQYSAKVAIKLVDASSLDAEIGRRFSAERQILASLNHPNIARLLDAGVAPAGPYLVMEYVHGERIDHYCDRLEFTIKQRIELILRVCSAVQYAHQALIVHRDLKPANILVTANNTPKLLDFGIAKLLDTDEYAARLALTRFSEQMLTPEYASPEQILGQPVSTASDVYSLGVLLYELLTGLRPYKVSSASQIELERSICVRAATKPSTAIRQLRIEQRRSVSATTRNVDSIANARQSTPQKLGGILSGDLDAILLKALRKEPEHRYQSVEQFTADLQRYLNKESVLARQGNWLYHSGRYIRRYKYPVAAGITIFSLLIGMTVNYLLQSQRLAAERDLVAKEKKTSDAVAEFMTNAFAATDPFTSPGKDFTAGELLDHSVEQLRADLEEEPEVRALLLTSLGKTYTRRGDDKNGLDLLEEALRVRRASTKVSPSTLASNLTELGRTHIRRYEYDKAFIYLQEALALLESSGQNHIPQYLDALLRMSTVTLNKGFISQSVDLRKRAMGLAKELFGEKHSDYGQTLSSYANVLMWMDRPYEALEFIRNARDIYQATLIPLNPDLVYVDSFLGACLLRIGKTAEATPVIEKSYLDIQQIYGENSIRIIDPLTSMIRLRIAQGKAEEAEALARKVMGLITEEQGGSISSISRRHEILGIALLERGAALDAEREFRTANEIRRNLYKESHPFVTSSDHFRSEALIRLGRYTEAEELLRKTILSLRATGMSSWRIARSEVTLAYALFKLDRRDEALAILEHNYKILTDSGLEPRLQNMTYRRLVEVHTSLGHSKRIAALEAEEVKHRKAAVHNLIITPIRAAL